MINYIRRECKSFLGGILVYCLVYAVMEISKYYLIEKDYISASTYGGSFNFLLQVSGTLLVVLPGYVSGWLSVRSGTLNGFFLMFVCTTASFIIKGHYIPDFSKVLDNIYLWIIVLLLPVSVGALGGAAGQHHKRVRRKL